MLGLGASAATDDSELPKPHFLHYDASQLLELDVDSKKRTVWSFPTTSDLSLSARLNDDDDRDLLIDEPGEVLRAFEVRQYALELEGPHIIL